MSAQEIIQIANELSARGITPSTAMVKARLSHPVPMAELLKVLSQWKQQPQPASTAPAPAIVPEASPLATESVTLQQLSEQLARLEQKVDRLTDLLLNQKPD
ncbi:MULTISPECIES: DNA-binding protein [Aeromonas]|jgi:DNA-binding transcriptional MerR regulator|uniref:DNA-binding protein n=1 Tax=Aeromonas TaxID=642 RepID=UPI0008526395|nr:MULTISPECIES: DNA-binding protein [Aeromonas]MCR3892060.1 DNA-binding protein [Aeromonas caviae]MCX4047922.1 DNA-binding protein [Aeromonas caviae]MCX4106993.1 DNA-binding protein [Aeromonas caviae]MCY9809146.1 DNA-binding protein [Aeromonas caviae]MDX7610568.1 DNA-binding protein [Aeromonas caviae]